MKLSGSLVGLIAQQLTPLAAMGGFVAKGKGGPGKDEGPKSLKADMMEDEAEDSEDEEHQMEKDALRAMEVGGRESLAAAYEAMAAKEVVYDTFSDELRAGYIARVQAREAWCEEVETSHEQREARDKALAQHAASVARSLRFGTAITHKRIPGWPAGGMHEHGW
ncbi:hypothetical protein AK812_SmicGene13300 [Symbiodinium microadriaticum]|uniref:Uncharacterized protein n=1 Tax=Symbiodinium microadriaticum TaxID=2951 RepID=A0A1Q9E8H7_SYMMI|nr:hypothetical protein AK812_SmicGene13300 [Symbiodinium microadriaticum]